ncbi:MAG: hypothetical protein HYT16_04450 [DPANN group archaeon]|nr:hypothetical protein [DPANN group archaeon]
MVDIDKKITDQINALGLPDETKHKIAAIIKESDKAGLRSFSEKIITEIGFAGKVALIPQDKLDYLKSNIKAMIKIETGGKD